MNPFLTSIKEQILNSQLTEQDKQALLKSLSEADKQWAITEFKLDRTEKVKKTTAILLEETIEELEKKRQAVEAQNREATIEASLERVRSKTMAMHSSEDVGNTVAAMFDELVHLGIETMRCGIGIMHEDEQMEIWTAVSSSDGERSLIIGRLDMTVHPLLQGVYHAWANKQSSFSYEMVGEDLKNYCRSINNLPDYPVRIDIESLPPKQVHTDFFFPEGALFAFTSERIAEDDSQIFKRFAGVFGQTYRRYLDLQKAEAQAREAKIEAALEKARSRTMGMQSSDELPEVANVLFLEVQALGIPAWSCGYNILAEDKNSSTCIMSSEGTLQTPFNLRLFGEASFAEWRNFLFSEKTMLVQELGNHALEEHYAYMKSFPDLKPTFDEIDRLGLSLPKYQINHLCKFAQGFLLFITYEKVPQAHDIFQRFTKVFEQTYTRFLDLQNAEAQARESQIQLALERVRARTMAMQHSAELQDAAILLFEQMKSLGIQTGSCGFNIWERKEKAATVWVSSPEGRMQTPFTLPHTESQLYRQVFEAMEKGEDFLVKEIGGETLVKHFEYLLTLPGIGSVIKHLRETGYVFPESMVYHFAFFNSGYLSFHLHEHQPEAHDIFRRFAKVFEQTYTRFLDLQKSETHAREVEIDLALERVRAQTMAMHNSEDVGKCIVKMFDELTALGVDEGTRFGIGILNHDNENIQLWTASKGGEKINLHIGNLDMSWHPLLKSARKAWQEQVPLHQYVLEGEDLVNYYKMINNAPDYKFRIAIDKLPEREIHYGFVFEHGFFYAFNHREFEPDLIRITQRFSSLFGQTYRRYLDLVKAEGQAREAEIELALERVRARTMAMRGSEELGDVATVLFKELNRLVDNLWTCGFVLCEKDRGEDEWWLSTIDGFLPVLHLPNTVDITHANIFDAWKAGATYHTEQLEGEALQEHYDWLMKIPASKEIFEGMLAAGFSLPSWQKLHCAYFSYGYLVMITQVPCPEEQVFKRFAQVFDQTYTRFLDLQKAEALAKEALKQASLDRIRGQVASMRSSDDLEHIIPMLWHELGMLDVPFIRCGVFIMNESDSIVNVYLSSPDGKSLGLLHLPFNAGGVTQNAVAHWRKKMVYKEHWNKDEFIAWMQTLIAAGQVHDAASYQGTSAPPESLHLNFVPFRQGMLYVGSSESMHPDIIELLKTLANTFSIAYSRYEDFRLLEDAKNRIETTLDELKATQSQLVQSEKMASLGELTAGIAHEIQNPLNFVNNFSELSNELIEEMEEEMKRGNSEEVNSIINDLRSNLEKINQHGRRADSIVKGMLQHSRVSTGEKEATDINGLADEYLRLAYHGFRAKDKSFNAILETDLDQSIGKIKAVPQELGRVLLNLYNNAFYAVNEKSGVNGFEPKVRLSTTKIGSNILIAVQDNGKGIPDKVKEKIFQPFFTTKPTGQGTGLGLSLSYDIVKAHGGEFKVDSIEGVGTSFIIQLPV